MAQFARPYSDISIGNWSPYPSSPTSLWDKIDEKIQNGDADYIFSDTNEDECEFGLSNVNDPQIGTGHIIRCYAKSPNGSGAKEQLTISLVENGAVRGSSPATNVDRTAHGLIEYTLPEAEANAIQNYENLRIRIHINNVNGGEYIRITQIELRVPGEGSTRFYLPSTGVPASTPAYDGGWEQTAAADRREMVTTKISSAFANKADSETNASQPFDVLLRQYISAAQYAAYDFSGTDTWKLQVRGLESSPSANYYLAIIAKVVSGDGGTVRGTLISFEADALEFDNGVLTNRSMSGSCQSVSMQDGDRVLIEIGFRSINTKTTSYQADIEFGDNSGTDLPEDDVSELQYNPWLELSATLPEAPGGDIEINKSEAVSVGELVLALVTACLISVTSAVSVGEASSAQVDFNPSVGEAVSIAESSQVALSDLGINVSDNATPSESSQVETEVVVAVYDSATVAEIVSVLIDFNPSISEAVSIGEATDLDIPLQGSAADAVSLGESSDVEVESGEPDISVSDSAAPGEVIDVGLSDLEVSILDSVTIDEAIGILLEILGLDISVSEAISLGEALDIALSILEILVSDAVSVGESSEIAVVSAEDINASVEDSVSLGEVLVVVLSDLEILVSDASSLGETLNVLIELLISEIDAISIDEAIVVDIAFEILALEAITPGEVVGAKVSGPNIEVSDAVSVVEAVQAIVSDPQISVSESITPSEYVEAYVIEPISYIGMLVGLFCGKEAKHFPGILIFEAKLEKSLVMEGKLEECP